MSFKIIWHDICTCVDDTLPGNLQDLTKGMTGVESTLGMAHSDQEFEITSSLVGSFCTQIPV